MNSVKPKSVEDVLNHQIKSLKEVKTIDELNKLRATVEKVMTVAREATNKYYIKNVVKYKAPDDLRKVILAKDIQALYASFNKGFESAESILKKQQSLNPPLTVRIKNCVSSCLPSRKTAIDYLLPSAAVALSIITDDPYLLGFYYLQTYIANR